MKIFLIRTVQFYLQNVSYKSNGTIADLRKQKKYLEKLQIKRYEVLLWRLDNDTIPLDFYNYQFICVTYKGIFYIFFSIKNFRKLRDNNTALESCL